MVRTHLEKAADWETLAQNELKYGGDKKKAGEYFLKQARAYEKASKFGKSLRAYKDALKYIPKTEEKKVLEEIAQLEEERRKMSIKFGIEKKFIFAILSVFFFVGTLFFVSVGLTGHSISNSSRFDFHFFGIVSFVLGLIFALIYFKPKNRKK